MLMYIRLEYFLFKIEFESGTNPQRSMNREDSFPSQYGFLDLKCQIYHYALKTLKLQSAISSLKYYI